MNLKVNVVFCMYVQYVAFRPCVFFVNPEVPFELERRFDLVPYNKSIRFEEKEAAIMGECRYITFRESDMPRCIINHIGRKKLAYPVRIKIRRSRTFNDNITHRPGC